MRKQVWFLGDHPSDSAIRWEEPRSYNVDHSSRGKAIIFNHKHYRHMLSPRTGTDADVENLKTALLILGFQKSDIIIHNDLTSSKIMEELEKIQQEDHTDRDLLMVFVLTHGNLYDYVHAYDTDYSVKRLWEPFTADKCKTLAGKPKLFFVVACRGDKEDMGFELQSGSPTERTEVDAKPIFYSRPHTVPVWSDFVYVFSTYEGFYSYRDVEQGTWYIKAFCDKLRESPIYKMSFLDFLTTVNGQIAMQYQTFPGQRKQIPIFSSTLTKCLVFKEKKMYRESNF